MLLSHLGNNGYLSQTYKVNVFADHTRRLKWCILIHPKAACVGASPPIQTLDFLGPFLSPHFKIFKLTWLYIRDIVEEILSANSTRYLYFLTTPQVWRSSGHNALTLHHLQKHTKIYTYYMKIFVTNSDMRYSAVLSSSYLYGDGKKNGTSKNKSRSTKHFKNVYTNLAVHRFLLWFCQMTEELLNATKDRLLGENRWKEKKVLKRDFEVWKKREKNTCQKGLLTFDSVDVILK